MDVSIVIHVGKVCTTELFYMETEVLIKIIVPNEQRIRLADTTQPALAVSPIFDFN